MIFRKLERVWSHNDMNYIPNFRETFPELRKISNEEMCDRWSSLGIDFYTKKEVPANKWIRLTFPFAIILMILMIIGLPIVFIVNGNWNYGLGEKNIIFNWFAELKLIN